MTKTFGPKDGASYIARANERWQPLPDWVAALAQAADATASQSAIGKRIGISASAVSAIIANNYSGSTRIVEAKVRGALMSQRVECPVLGSLARNDCVANQSLPFSAANPQRAQLYKACRSGCPNAMKGTK